MPTTIPAPLANKVALVTGGSQGIGAAIAHSLAEQSVTHLAITYASNSRLAENVLSEIQKTINPAIKTTAISANLTDSHFAENVISATLENLQTDHIDIFVSNAAFVGTAGQSPAATLTKATWDTLMSANAWTPFSVSRHLVEHNLMPPGGRIILITSGSSKMAQGDPMLAYAASKAALDSISRNLAVVYGKSRGITVNTISVGATKTDGLWDAMEGVGGDEFIKFAERMSTLGRLGEARDVADIVAFVASDASRWMNGNQIPANGGALSMCQS